MAPIAVMMAKKAKGILAADDKIPAVLAALAMQEETQLPTLAADHIVAQKVAAELSEKSLGTKYPVLYVYCNKLVNELREKFRRFSGQAQMVVEARVSQDRLEDIETNLQVYVDAITQVLDGSRGDWGDGVTYGGGYEVTFGSVKHGGRNFIQTAKVSFAVEISAD